MGGGARFFQADVAEEEQIAAMFDFRPATFWPRWTCW